MKPQKSVRSVLLCVLATYPWLKMRPLDAGIIWSFKSAYKRRLMRNIVNALDDGHEWPPITIADALRFASDAWHELPPRVVSNCWRRTGIAEAPTTEAAAAAALAAPVPVHPSLSEDGHTAVEELRRDMETLAGETVAADDALAYIAVDDAEETEDPDVEGGIVAAVLDAEALAQPLEHAAPATGGDAAAAAPAAVVEEQEEPPLSYSEFRAMGTKIMHYLERRPYNTSALLRQQRAVLDADAAYERTVRRQTLITDYFPRLEAPK